MGVQLQIETGNAAFEEGSRSEELYRIVTKAADRVESEGPALPDAFSVRDTNGNTVGKFEQTPCAALSDTDSFVLLAIEHTANAAFEDPSPAAEVARILREAADRLARGDTDFALHDVNGNRVGSVSSRLVEATEELEDQEEGNDESGDVQPYTSTPIIGDAVVDRHGQDWQVCELEYSVVRDVAGRRTEVPWALLLSGDESNVVVTRLVSDLVQGMSRSERTLEYVINLDERGAFYADVRESDGSTIFEIKGASLFEDGFMKNSRDLDGLAQYLRALKIIGPYDHILDTTEYQDRERTLHETFAAANREREEASALSWYGTISAAESQRALLQSVGAELLPVSPPPASDIDKRQYRVRFSEEAWKAFEPFQHEFTCEARPLSAYDQNRLETSQFDDAGLDAYIAFLQFTASRDDEKSLGDSTTIGKKLADAEEEKGTRLAPGLKSQPGTTGSAHANEP